MADINKAIKALGVADWAKKAEEEAEHAAAAPKPPAAPKPGAAGSESKGGADPAKAAAEAAKKAVEEAGKKAAAAAAKDAADMTTLLKDFAAHFKPETKAHPPDLGKIEAIGKKHHLTDAQIKKALKDAGYDVH